MTVGYPPVPIFPLGIDSDRTLFLVYNTSETTLYSDNQPWSDEMSIEPVGDDELEQWGENGFANISGELFYYDGVEKNSAGKINKFIRIVRNIGGSQTQYNRIGTKVRGYIIAEHHNQLVDTAIEIEKYTLDTLDPKIKYLNDLPDCVDDWICVDIDFDFSINEEASNNCVGIVSEYSVIIKGEYNRYRIDFGDGTFTTTTLEGTHTYAPNADIDPIITVQNDKCTVTQTPTTRTNPQEPTRIDEEDEFLIPIPEVPDIPVLDCFCDVPSTTLTIPPVVLPCLEGFDTGGFNISIPSLDINIPSQIVVVGANIPSEIIIIGTAIPTIISIESNLQSLPSVITFDGAPVFPTSIAFDNIPVFPTTIEFGMPPYIPPTINFGPVDIPNTINIVGGGGGGGGAVIPTIISFEVPEIPTVISIEGCELSNISLIAELSNISLIAELSDISLIIPEDAEIGLTIPESASISLNTSYASVDLITTGKSISVTGIPDTLPVEITITCGGVSSESLAMQAKSLDVDTYQDHLPSDNDPFVQLDAHDLGIPSEISIVAPKFDDINLVHDIPEKIKLDASEIKPIKIDHNGLPQTIEIKSDVNIPTSINIEHDMPKSINIDSNLPNEISLIVPTEMPTMIKLDASDIPHSIQVTGIPDFIELKHDLPSEIKLTAPEDLEVPLVYKGDPVPVKFDINSLTDDAGDAPCFALVPCSKK